LSGLFFVLTLGAYARYIRCKRPIVSYSVVALMLGLGLLAKPMLVTVPVILLLLDYWPLGRINDRGTLRRAILEKLPLFLLVAASLAATIMAQRAATGSMGELPLPLRLQNAVASCAIYIGQMFWPARLTVFYPHPENTLSVWELVLGIALLGGVTLLALVLRQRRPYLLAGWLWYLVMLIPVIGIFQVGLQGHADRYTYLPQIGLYLMVTWAAGDLIQGARRRVIGLTIVALVGLLALCLCAWRQVTYWKDSEALWRHASTVTPGSDVALAGLGEVFLTNGKVDAAIKNFREALRIRPDNAEVHSALADALTRNGQAQEAVPHWERAVVLQPEDVQARDQLGALLVQQGRWRDGLGQWRESLKYNPDDANALSNLAWVLATAADSSARDGAQAVAFAQRASRIAGGANPLILRTLAAAKAETGDFAGAMETGARAIERATEQHNPELADELRRNMALYQAKTPLRDPALRDSTP
jgi:tetratricopeptide (TPR) repeat protein